MTATGTEVFTTVYNYNNKSGKYTSLIQSESKKFINEHTGKEETSITAYEYDKNGSQLVKTNNEKTERNTYDSTGQLISYTDGETTASYTYDVNGLRRSKTVDGETITHIWNGNGQIIADVTEGKYYQADCYVQSTGITAKYSFTNGRKTAYEYYLKNAHGDVVGITDDTGAVKKIYRYDAFGVEKNKDESDTNAFRYCGEYYDKESDTIYLRARYYSPTTGRFISRDSDPGTSADPLSLNLYTYCHNNPVLYTDPSGHSIKKWFKDRVDDWKVGISMLKDMGGAGEVFASYSEGVVDSLGSTVSAVAHPVKTAKEMGAGVKAIANDPSGAVSQFTASVKNTISDVRKGDFNSVAYMIGGLSVDVAGGAAGKVTKVAKANMLRSAMSTSGDVFAAAKSVYNKMPKKLKGCIYIPDIPTRKQALNKIRKDLGISKRQQPESTRMVILRDEFDMPVINKGKMVYSREMTYKVNGKFDGANKPITHVVIQDHSYGHKYESGIGNQTSHFNVRPIESTRNGKVKGLEEHYYFNSKYDFKD